MNRLDKFGILVLTVLYFIQGIPIGIAGTTIPLVLTEQGVSYKDLAMLSFALYPFSFKIFFAPI